MVYRPAPSARNRVGVHSTKNRRKGSTGSKRFPRCSLVATTVFIAGFLICLVSTVYVYYEFNSLAGSGAEVDNVVAFTRNLIARERTTTAPQAFVKATTTTTSGKNLRGGTGAAAMAAPEAAAVGKEQARMPQVAGLPSPASSLTDDSGLYQVCYPHGITSVGRQPSAHLLNDGYCDCASGADEPLTPACSRVRVAQGVFDCGNGQPLLFLSRVNDGVCDCANGRDEPGVDACAHQVPIHKSRHLGW